MSGAGVGAGAGSAAPFVAATDPEFTFTQDKVDCPGGIDYDRVVDMFGVQRINNDLVERIERLTHKPAHLFLKRGAYPRSR